MADELDQDSQALLTGLGIDPNPQDPSRDDDPIVVPARADDDDPIILGGDGGSDSRRPAPQGDYVPKADFDALRQQLAAQQAQFDAIQQQLGQRAAQQFTPQQPQPYVPPSQYGQPDNGAMQQQLQEAYYRDPVAFTAQVAQAAARAAVQQQGAPIVAAQQQTEVTVAQQVISNLRSTFASQNPDLARLALPAVDAIVQSTPPDKLAQFLRDGTLQSHYENAYHQEVGKKLGTVYATAAQRRAASKAVSEPPNISGGSVTSIAGKRAGGEVRMSDLDEATKEAIKEGAKYGVSAETILAMDA